MASEQTFVIGDVHGCAEELRLLLGQLPLGDRSRIVFVGDYIDRGPRSREVVDTVLELSTRHEVVPLMGNHESMLIDFLEAPQTPTGGAFIMNGGSATLASYADAAGNYEIPAAHHAFFKGLALSHEDDEHFFVHAGVPNVPLAKLDPVRHRMTMLWVREPFLRSQYSWDKLVVHGHTPVPAAEVHARRINMDSGCVFNGLLSALELRTGKIWAVPRQAQRELVFLRDQGSQRVAIRFQGVIPVTIDRTGDKVALETVDYNDFGALVRETIVGAGDALTVGERIEGRLGPDGAPQALFRGVVLRRQEDERGVSWAVKFLAPPRIVEWAPPPPTTSSPAPA